MVLSDYTQASLTAAFNFQPYCVEHQSEEKHPVGPEQQVGNFPLHLDDEFSDIQVAHMPSIFLL